MIITAKATQSDTRPVDPAEAYVLKNAYEKSKAPHAFFLFLMGIGLYLKSIYPGWARPAEEDARDETEAGSDLRVAELDAAADQPALEEELTTGTPGADPGPGVFSGGTLVPLQQSARFSLIGSPEVDFFFAGVEPDAFALVEPYRQSLRATNDNLPDFIGGGGGGAGPSGPRGEEPGGDNPGPGTDDPGTGPSDPDGPEDPGNPGDPDDPVCEGPGTGGPCDDDDEDDEDDEDEEEEEQVVNRAPRVAGSVHLYDITACAILAIGLIDLLRGASDPDGDALSVTGLSASAGTLTATSFGWTFQPAPFAYGPVTLSYAITDGSLSLAQTAHFTVLARGWFEGTAGDDMITASLCADDIDGGAGDDVLAGLAGNDVIQGGAGNDHILAGDGDDTVYAGSGNDIVLAGGGNDIVFGGAGDDRLFGEDGDDILNGEEGDDVLSGGTGRDMLFGGLGNDVLQGDEGDDHLDGGAGDDRLDGGTGNDRLIGGAGDDLLEGQEGNDVIEDGAGADIVLGGTGDDTVVAAIDGANDRYDGGVDYDAVDYSLAEFKLAIDMELGTASGEEIGCDTITGFEKVVAGSGDDVIAGSANDDHIVAGAGDDVIEGKAGDDVIEDGSCADIVLGGAGDDTVVAAMDGANDRYDGGVDYDAVDYSLAEFKLAIDMELGTASGEEIGCDTITGFEKVVAGAGDDVVAGSANDDHIVAGAGDDVIEGQGGDDVIEDGAGADIVLAGTGDDTVVAAMDGANDQYDGGEGCDVLDYSAATDDLLIDLTQGQATGIEIGCDTITGFETVVAGAGDDHLVVGESEVALYGGEGENVFEFCGPGEDTAQPLVFEIHDFKTGDRVRIGKYDIFEQVLDDLEDDFAKVYGDKVDEEDYAVRTRLEEFDGYTRTIIEADFNGDDIYETSIIIDGRHVLVMVETA